MSKDTRTPEQIKGQHGACATVYIQGEKSDGNPTGLVRVDAHNVPDGAEVVDTKKAEKLLAAAPKKKGDEDTDDATDWTKKTVPELKAHLAEKGVSIDSDAKKPELVALCEANP